MTTIAVTRVAVATSTGDQDITTAKLNGLTPKAVWFNIVRATSDGTPANHAVCGMGAASGLLDTDEETGEEIVLRWASSYRSENGVGTTDSSRDGEETACVMILNPTDGSVDGQADFRNFIENGVRIRWSNAPASAYLMTATFFAGDDMEAQVSSFTLGNENIEVDVTQVGFQPDVVIVATNGLTLGSSGNSMYYSHGAVTYDGDAIRQNGWIGFSDDGAGTSSVGAYISSAEACGQINAGAVLWLGEFNNFDASGFSCTARQGNSNDDIGYLALKFNDGTEFWTGVVDTPIAGGNQQVSGSGLTFQPQYIHGGLTQLDTEDLLDNTGDAGSLGTTLFDFLAEYCHSTQDEDGQATTDTQSLSDDTAVDFPQDDGSAGHAATFVSFDIQGFTWNFSATLGTAKKWWILAIEGISILPPSEEIAVVVVGASAPAGVGLQDITTPDLADKVPSAALFTILNTLENAAPQDDAVLGLGAVATDGSQWAICIQAEDAVGTTNTNRRGIVDGCVLKLLGTSSAVDGEAEFVSFIKNGVRLNWTNAPAGTFAITVMLFSGVSGHADVFTMPNLLDDIVDVTDPGFKPEIIFTATIDRDIDDVGDTEAKLSHGCVTDEGQSQHNWAWNSQDNQAASDVGAQISAVYGIMAVSEDGVAEWAGLFHTFDGNGFSVTNKIAASDAEVAYLAISFDGNALISLDIIDTPTQLGFQSVTAPEFKPYAVWSGLTQLPSTGTAF